MPAIQTIARRLRCTDGAEIAEAALVLPLTFLMVFGAVWFGRAFHIYATIQQAAQQGTIAAARSTCSSCGDAVNATVYTTINSVLQASNLDPAKTQLPPSPPKCATGTACAACPSPPFPTGGSCSSANNVYVCRNVQLNPGATPVVCGTVVSFQYPFDLSLSLFNNLGWQNIKISTQAQSRVED